MRLPKYRRHSSGKGYVCWKKRRYYLPGKYNSEESLAAYRRFIDGLLKKAAGQAAPSVANEAPGHPLSPPACSGQPITIFEAAPRYLRFSDSVHRDPQGRHTAEHYHIRRMIGLIVEMHGLTPIDEFGPLAFRSFRNRMVECKKIIGGKKRIESDQTWTRSYVNQQAGRVRKFFAWAVAEQLVPAAVAESLKYLPPLRRRKTVAREGKKVRPPDNHAVTAVLGEVSPTLFAMIAVHDSTGMRPTELCTMRPADIDRTVQPWEYRPQQYKTQNRDEEDGCERLIFLGPKAQFALESFLDRDPDAYCFDPRESAIWFRNRQNEKHRDKFKWPYQLKKKPPRIPKTSRRIGDHYSADSYRRAIRRAAVKTKAAHWFPYQLRHKRGTIVRKDYNLEGSQVILGHKHANVTQLYAERDWDFARKIARETG